MSFCHTYCSNCNDAPPQTRGYTYSSNGNDAPPQTRGYTYRGYTYSSNGNDAPPQTRGYTYSSNGNETHHRPEGILTVVTVMRPTTDQRVYLQ